MKHHFRLITFVIVCFTAQYGWSAEAAQSVARANTDLVIFSFDRPLQLYALLESVDTYVTGLNSIQVIYRASSKQFAQAYDEVKYRFDNVLYRKQGNHPQEDFKPLVLKAVSATSAEYIVFAVDDNIVKDTVDFNESIALMEKHTAYGVYLRLGTHLCECYSMGSAQKLPPLVKVEPNAYMWVFSQGQHDWAYPHTVDLTLYRKKDVKPYLYAFSYHSPNSLEGIWACNGHRIMHKQGLCYACSKIVNIPLNRVQNEIKNRAMEFMSPAELLEQFNNKKKIDISLLHKVNNKAAHMAYEPVFVERG